MSAALQLDVPQNSPTQRNLEKAPISSRGPPKSDVQSERLLRPVRSMEKKPSHNPPERRLSAAGERRTRNSTGGEHEERTLARRYSHTGPDRRGQERRDSFAGQRDRPDMQAGERSPQPQHASPKVSSPPAARLPLPPWHKPTRSDEGVRDRRTEEVSSPALASARAMEKPARSNTPASRVPRPPRSPSRPLSEAGPPSQSSPSMNYLRFDTTPSTSFGAGQPSGTPRSCQRCRFCDCQEADSEEHMLLRCSLHSAIRTDLARACDALLPSTWSAMSDKERHDLLRKDPRVQQPVNAFMMRCTRERDSAPIKGEDAITRDGSVAPSVRRLQSVP